MSASHSPGSKSVGFTADDEGRLATVLVVDDDHDSRAVIVQMLAPLGVNVVEAGDGLAALTTLNSRQVDVVVSDLLMPRMSGLMLLHTMLEQNHPSPFVLVTGYSDKDSAIQALRLGAFDYLEKPIHASDLQPIVQEAIKVSRAHASMTVNERVSVASEDAKNAELMLFRMRALRFPAAQLDLAVSRNNLQSWQGLRNLFAQEAEAQLVFCEGAIQAIQASENLPRDLALILRLVQSVRMAAETIKVMDIADIAWAVETTLATMKSAPEVVTDANIHLLLQTNSVLRTKIAGLIDPQVVALCEQLGALTEAFAIGKKAS